VLTSLHFHFRRHLQLLRRALASVQAKGWRATWQRVQSTAIERVPAGAGPHDDSTADDSGWGDHPWVLVVDGSVPTPDRDSGSLRLHNLLRVLVAGGYRVAFVADDGGADPAGAARLRAAGIHVPRLRNAREFPAWVQRHCGTLSASILCRHHTAMHWLPLVRALAPQSLIVFDTVDLHFLREQRGAELQGDPRLRRQSEATRRRELELVDRADTTWVVSPIERDLLLEARPEADVRVVSNIIDEDTPGRPFEQRKDLLFVGGLRHTPNRDAVEWLSRHIFPRIRQALPHVQLHLVGAPDTVPMPPPPLDSGIHVHGHVPDIAPYLDGCRLALAPLRFGAGVKGKVNLSLAHGQPVVATECAIEGMHLSPDTDVLVANTADAFVDQVVRLYDDAALWRHLSDAGRANVRRHFSPATAREVVTATLGPATGAGRR
jgi:glycosyltransferase involved in cell wall biosynthesis